MVMIEMLKRLGLLNGNCGDDSWSHNGGWYDNAGYKVGWGDLGPKDIVRVQAGLRDGEVLWVIGEHDSFWDLPKSLRPEAPGIEYVQQKARYAITNRKVLVFRDHCERGSADGWYADHSVGVKGIKLLKRTIAGGLDHAALKRELETPAESEARVAAEDRDSKAEQRAEDKDRSH